MSFFNTMNEIIEKKNKELLAFYKKKLRTCSDNEVINQLHQKTLNGASYEVIELINKEMQRRGLS